MRSLKDLMLEQSVLNFGEIFSKEKQSVSFEVENGTTMSINQIFINLNIQLALDK